MVNMPDDLHCWKNMWIPNTTKTWQLFTVFIGDQKAKHISWYYGNINISKTYSKLAWNLNDKLYTA